MSANPISRFYSSTIGKKVVVAITGLVMLGFVVAHMAGNLKMFGGINSATGVHKLDEYAVFLRMAGAQVLGEEGLLWAFRAGLLVALVLHVVTVIQLLAINKRANPEKYASSQGRSSTLAARTMYWGGLLLLFFIVFHILHFTTGDLHFKGFEHGKVYANVYAAFSTPALVALYVVAMTALAFHLYHGSWSVFQTLGLDTPAWNSGLRLFAKTLAVVVALGFITVPLAVMFKLVPPPAAATHVVIKTLEVR